MELSGREERRGLFSIYDNVGLGEGGGLIVIDIISNCRCPKTFETIKESPSDHKYIIGLNITVDPQFVRIERTSLIPINKFNLRL